VPEDLDRGGPEELLAGSDRPRPLTPVLRARLERTLLAVSGDTAPRPLSPAVRDRLESSLRGPGGTRRTDRWKRIVPGAGVAAAIAVLAAILVPQLVNGPNRPGGTVAARAAGPTVARLGLSAPPVAVSNGPSGRKSRGVPAGVARHAGPNRFAPGATSGASLVPRRALPSRTGPGPVVPGPMAAVVETPAVSGVSPRQGPTGGGNWVVVTGQGFVGISAVDFGTTAAVSFAVESPVRLKVRAPAHAAGTVDIVVTAAAGRSGVSAGDRYSFGP
jgi:hypothetical protein